MGAKLEEKQQQSQRDRERMKLKRDPEEKNEFTEPRDQGREINQEP